MSVCKEEFKVRILKRRMEVELVRVTRDVKYKVDSVGERRDPRFVQNWLNSLLPHITTLKKKEKGDNAVAVGMAEGFFCGMQIEIIGEFVAAGVVGTNPFTRNTHDYNVKDYDRYVYHVVNVFEPKDALLLEEYRAAAVENRRMLM